MGAGGLVGLRFRVLWWAVAVVVALEFGRSWVRVPCGGCGQWVWVSGWAEVLAVLEGSKGGCGFGK